MKRRKISERHPLRKFLREAIYGSFDKVLGVHEQDVEDYLAHLLVDFAHIEASNLETPYGPLDDLLAMIYAGDIRYGADSFEREREVHKHIGDFVMFWEGLFPEQKRLFQKRGALLGLLDTIALGKSSYYIVSTFDYGEFSREAWLFRRLSEGFENYLEALRSVRNAWQKGVSFS
ncbi:MAG TPA: hypothetical protein VNK96_01130 [Fimbriimonadales bacterium]|nr:hypothetical protein [Fimbriimonadales bacterium]